MQMGDARGQVDLRIDLEALVRETERVRTVSGDRRAQLDAILQRTSHAAVACDAASGLVVTNREATRLWAGRAADDARHRPYARFEIIGEGGDRAELTDWLVAQCNARMSDGVGSIEVEEVVLERLDGSRSAMLVGSVPMRGPLGEFAGALCVLVEKIPSGSRVESVQAAHRRASFLVQASTQLLSTSFDPDETLRRLAALIVSAVADCCSIVVMDEATGTVRKVVDTWSDPAKHECAMAMRDRFPDPHESAELVRVMKTGVPELHAEISDALLRHVARDPEHLEMLRSLGIRSAMIAPLLARQGVVGAFSLVSTELGRVYNLADLDMAEQLGASGGLALENARLYQSEQRARSEMVVLYRLVDAVHRATTIAGVYDCALDAVQAALGEFPCSILVADGDGRHRFKAWRGVSSDLRDLHDVVGPDAPWATDDSDPRPILVANVDEGERLSAFRALVRGETSRSVAIFPLVHHGEVLGMLVTGWTESRDFADVTGLMQTIAAQVSQAVVRKRTEAEAEAARADAEYASRMKDEFLAVVSHELRTPLSSIMGWSTILRTERRNDPNMLLKGLAVIERNAKAQARIIEDILDVSRIIRGKLLLDARPLSLEPLVVETIESLRTSATAREILLEFQADEDSYTLVGDPERVRQITWNLVANAIKFTPVRGRVWVRLRREDGAIVLQVEDTGRGITPDFLPYVFDRFRQADSSTTRREGGLGLGLSIVRHLVELHGGQVNVASAGPGLGTSFSVRFPVSAVSRDMLAPVEAGLDGTQGSAHRKSVPPCPLRPHLDGMRVLVVDDQADARDMLTEALESYGAAVAVAGSVLEAVEVIGRFKPGVLVTDIGMPDEDGYALLRRVRDMPSPYARVPAVAVTAYARAEDALRAREAGFQRHVTKPVRPETLAIAVAEVSAEAAQRS